jgi:hypothetical protein
MFEIEKKKKTDAVPELRRARTNTGTRTEEVNHLLHFHPSRYWQISNLDVLYDFGSSSAFPWKHQLLLVVKTEDLNFPSVYAESHTCFHQT